MIGNAPTREPFKGSVEQNTATCFIPKTWIDWYVEATRILQSVQSSGTTTNRPTANALLWVGRQYFDTTLGKPIFYSGSGWVDATGSSV